MEGVTLLAKTDGISSLNADGCVPPSVIPLLSAQFKGLHVNVVYPGNKFREITVSGVSSNTADKYQLDIKDKSGKIEKYTVQAYYKKRYDLDLA
jgi:hypothetical protein